MVYSTLANGRKSSLDFRSVGQVIDTLSHWHRQYAGASTPYKRWSKCSM